MRASAPVRIHGPEPWSTHARKRGSGYGGQLYRRVLYSRISKTLLVIRCNKWILGGIAPVTGKKVRIGELLGTPEFRRIAWASVGVGTMGCERSSQCLATTQRQLVTNFQPPILFTTSPPPPRCSLNSDPPTLLLFAILQKQG